MFGIDWLVETEWHIYTSVYQPIIDLYNGLSLAQHQANIWTNDNSLLIGPLRTNSSEIVIEIKLISFKKMHLEMSSAKWLSFCLGLNVLMRCRYASENRGFFKSPSFVHVTHLRSTSFELSPRYAKGCQRHYFRVCQHCKQVAPTDPLRHWRAPS